MSECSGTKQGTSKGSVFSLQKSVDTPIPGSSASSGHSNVITSPRNVKRGVTFDDHILSCISRSKFIYIAVQGSPYTAESSIFGLNVEETETVTQKFNEMGEMTNGILVEGSVLDIINMLGNLGYNVIDSTGIGSITWTLVKEVPHSS